MNRELKKNSLEIIKQSGWKVSQYESKTWNDETNRDEIGIFDDIQFKDKSLVIKLEKGQKTISLEFTRLECNLVLGSEEHYQEFWVDFNTYKGLRGVA